MTKKLKATLLAQVESSREALDQLETLLQETDPHAYTQTFAGNASGLIGEFVRRLTRLRLHAKAW